MHPRQAMLNTDCFAECIGKLPGGGSLPSSFLPSFSVESTLNSLSAKKADYKSLCLQIFKKYLHQAIAY